MREFVRVLGYETFHVGASSTARWGITRLRVALVLDNTGSMADDGKMPALKTATKNLIDQLHGAVTTDGDVYVSIIPFAKDVNLGKSNFAADWIYWAYRRLVHPGRRIRPCLTTPPGMPTTATAAAEAGTRGAQMLRDNVGTCSVSGYTNQDSCTSSGMCNHGGYSSESTCTSHGTCSNPSYTKKSSCQSHGGTWTLNTWTSYNGIWTVTGTWTPKVHNATNWNGCVWTAAIGTIRIRPTILTPMPSPPDPVTPRWSSLYAAEQYGSCPKAVKGLTYEWDNMKTLVDSMSPAGNTNQAIGLQVGWMSLVGGGPFTVPAMDP